MSVYGRGQTVWLTVRAGTFAGTIKHVSTVPGVKGPYVVEYRDASNKLRTHNAASNELESRVE